MNPTKTKYARERAAQIKEMLCEKIRQEKQYKGIDDSNSYADTNSTAQLRKDVGTIIATDVNVAEYIKSWEIKRRSYYNDTSLKVSQNYTSFEEIIKKQLDILANTKEQVAARQTLRDDRDRRVKAVKAEHNRVMDMVVLGNESEAGLALVAFASMTV